VTTAESQVSADDASLGDTEAMGFNPHRRRVARKSDYLFVGAAAAACIVLVLWTLLG
jgi:hypothetical protein